MENGKQPAYPVTEISEEYDVDIIETLGLTKREYFAGLAMQGLLTRFIQEGKTDTCLTIFENKRIASEAVIMADNILEALDRPKSK
jgi:hypothetical protein